VPEQIRKAPKTASWLRKQKDSAGGTCRADCFSRSRGAAGDRRAEDCGADFFDATSIRQVVSQKLTRAGTPAIALWQAAVDAIGPGFAQSAGGSADMGGVAQPSVSSVAGRAGVPAISLKAEFQRAHLSTSKSSFCATQQLQSEPELIRWRDAALRNLSMLDHAYSRQSPHQAPGVAAALSSASSASKEFSPEAHPFANIATPGTRSICAVDGGPHRDRVWIRFNARSFLGRDLSLETALLLA